MKQTKEFHTPWFIVFAAIAVLAAGCATTAGAPVTKTALINAVATATKLNNSRLVGTELGRVSKSAKDVFTSAIAAAQAVVDKTSVTQTAVNTAVTTLEAASAAFRAAIVQSAAEKAQYSVSMIFDCKRTVGSDSTFTASNLTSPYDDSAASRLVTIPELTPDQPGFLPGAYIKLEITTKTDGDAIEVAALTLRKADGTVIRVISADGTINYLGSEGFIYISKLKDYGYYFSSKPRTLGAQVTYTFMKTSAAKMSDLTLSW